MPQFDIRTAEHVVLPRELLMLAALLRNGFGRWHNAARPDTQTAVMKEQSLVTVMNEQIKQAIRTRASSARSQAEVADAIFSTLRDYRVDMKHVSLEEMKSAVVEATRAAREDGNENDSLPV